MSTFLQELAVVALLMGVVYADGGYGHGGQGGGLGGGGGGYGGGGHGKTSERDEQPHFPRLWIVSMWIDKK